MSDKGQRDSQQFRMTLPWLIGVIAATFMFLAFLIAMYFEFYPSVFFGVLLLIIALTIIFDGIHRRKENRLSSKLSLIMGVIAIIASIIFIASGIGLIGMGAIISGSN